MAAMKSRPSRGIVMVFSKDTVRVNRHGCKMNKNVQYGMSATARSTSDSTYGNASLLPYEESDKNRLYLCIANCSDCDLVLTEMQGQVEWGPDRGPPTQLSRSSEALALFAAVFDFPSFGESQIFSLCYQELSTLVCDGGGIRFMVTIHDDRILLTSMCPNHREVHHRTWSQPSRYGFNIRIY